MQDKETMLGHEVPQEDYGKLETFPVSAPVHIEFSTEELQALCPGVQGIQPDLYKASISYTAVTHAIESKSLKLWLVTFRDERIYAEHLAVKLYNHITELKPKVEDIYIHLEQNIRGGIITSVKYPT